MRDRDRLILIGAVVVAVLVVSWMFWVSPERKKAATVHDQVATAQQTLSTAQTQLSSAQTSKAQYADAYAALVGVGKAVPPTAEVPSLIYEVNHAAGTHGVGFTSIATANSAAGSTAAVVPSGFTPMPFQFTFTGTFTDLYHLLGRLQSFEVQTPSGKLVVTGRLLTITSASLAVAGGGSSTPTTGTAGTAPSAVVLTGDVNATAYVLPPTVPTTGAATTAGAPPTTGSSATPATPALIGTSR